VYNRYYHAFEFRTYNWYGIRRLPSNLDQADISAKGPVYDEAYLNELKANTPSSRPRIPESGVHDDDTLMLSTPGDPAMESFDNIGNKPTVYSFFPLLYANISFIL
jgi:hypothetical protein